ncbi:diacylglycerol lipase-beta [Microcaecilia unicolor]|uniref:Diacylglycerol lipase-beta n=1 Tax=Microcaecilia unicolor TaxID=1415580 RepID=A0A6P7YJB4_9AMPH|nr:sn1-specific diacylglycerol lipase beta [Microcaecilia unicolor]XP_030067548.1 sn1-specific diacylglycerol lipase beta [Microcaecilia unicolor]
MPGLVMFGRRWAIASDDLVFPGAFELFLRVAWWIGILLLYSGQKGHFECSGGLLLRIYLIGLIVLLAAIICSTSAIVYVSMQGTISNPGPRQSIPKLIYIRLALYVPEFVWATLGAIWISDAGVNCDRTVVSVVMGAVIISWIIIFFTTVAVVIVFDPLGKKKVSSFPCSDVHDLESSQSMQVLYNVKSKAARVWENRIKSLCCCIGHDDDNRAAFSSIAELFSSYFSDTDLVPSDIAAGLTLLHQEQDKVELCRDPEDVVCLPPSPPMSGDLDAELEKAAHYMQFAAAAYGWPLYIFSNPLTGLCKLSGDCCRNRTSDSDIVGGDYLNCHFGSILQITGLQYRDFIHISFHNKIYEIPFFIALDHKTEAILVAVRGTLSLEDVLTDLSADCETLTVEGVQGDCFAHKGIIQAANYVYGRLINDGILNQAFTIAPEYKLVIVGHSLGAGAASILAILLKNSFPTLRCYAFSPPGGLLSKPLADYSKDFIVTVVVGKDFISRLSMPNMEDLKNRILRMVVNCNKPKYRILLQGCWYEMFGGNPDDFPTELDRQSQAALSQPLLAEESLTRQSPSYNTLFEGSPLNSPSQYPLLYLPGRIIHIVEKSRTGRFCFSDVEYSAKWSKETMFSSIFISPKMITDHMPDVVLKALRSLFQDKEQCISCQTPQSPSSAMNNQ